MSNALTLFQISDEYRQAAAQVVEECADDEAMLFDTLEAIRAPLEQKAVNVAKFIKNLKATASEIDEAIAPMEARSKALKAKADRIERYLHFGMAMSGIERIESPWFVLKLQDNPGSVDVYDATKVPEEYLREQEPAPPRAIDRAAAIKALRAGERIPGLRLDKSQRLIIK